MKRLIRSTRFLTEMFEEEPRITLDKKAFKALAGETRIKILKLLDKRRHTQTELAQNFGMAIPTVKQHLDELEKAGLVAGIEEGRKWRYYELTDAGATVLNPERPRNWIVLSLLVLAVLGGLTGIVKQMLAPMYAGKSLAAPAMEKALLMKETVASPDAAKQLPWGWIIYAGVLVVLLILLVYFVWKNRNHH